MNFFVEEEPTITVFTEEREYDGSRFPGGEIGIVRKAGGNCGIRLTAGNTPVRFLRLRWTSRFADDTLFLGDAWERTYGDSQWRGMDAGRMMPWFFLARRGDSVYAAGVRVRPGAFALWSVDPAGVTLWLDVRCGARGVVLSGRTLDVADVVFAEYGAISSFQAGCRFCRELCGDPVLSPLPVYGVNNWYYAYGNSTAESILADADALARLTEGVPNRPFMVIDDGWEVEYSSSPNCNAGPWNRSNSRHPDMAGLAAGIRARGCRPGLWFRPLWNLDPAIPPEWKSRRNPQFLDPSVPGVLEWVRNDIRTFTKWGYELIKYDFSTWDIFGRWGFEMTPWPAAGEWSFADAGRTSAEIVASLYRAIFEAAGDSLILGCNTVGHLGAGLMQLARTGDDTSGRCWERTRKMGVNTLAFRLMQHRAFFDIDADCAGITAAVPWRRNAQWTELLASSGTPLFVSVAPGVLDSAQEEQLKGYLKIASEQKLTAEPLDWERNNCPGHWLIGRREVEFDWYEPQGALPDFI